ncbi:MAG: hypothetical protein Q8N51_05785 [Gammaproteobacteria bacterium]|nr:hypothetical protein [Gammaproteobacteria bacterium]
MAYKKDPNATLDYTFDWSAWLTPISDAISSVTWVLSTGITIVSTSFTAATATAFIAGGVLGGQEELTCRITTVGGRVDDRTVFLNIVNR